MIITENKIPIFAIECKLTDGDISNGLKYFKRHFPACDAWQISLEGTKDYLSKDGIHVCSAIKFLVRLV